MIPNATPTAIAIVIASGNWHLSSEGPSQGKQLMNARSNSSRYRARGWREGLQAVPQSPLTNLSHPRKKWDILKKMKPTQKRTYPSPKVPTFVKDWGERLYLERRAILRVW